MSDKNALLACPWCGIAGKTFPTADGWMSGCLNDACDATVSLGSYVTEGEAIAAWNRRALAQAPAIRHSCETDMLSECPACSAEQSSLAVKHDCYETGDAVDQVARMIAEHIGHGMREKCEVLAERIVALIRPPAATTVPDGYVLVPAKLTPEMAAAGSKAARHSEVDGYRLLAIYRAMLAAAPTPPAVDGFDKAKATALVTSLVGFIKHAYVTGFAGRFNGASMTEVVSDLLAAETADEMLAALAKQAAHQADDGEGR